METILLFPPSRIVCQLACFDLIPSSAFELFRQPVATLHCSAILLKGQGRANQPEHDNIMDDSYKVQVASGKSVSEVEVDEFLTGQRRAQTGFVEPSFPTIAGEALCPAVQSE